MKSNRTRSNTEGGELITTNQTFFKCIQSLNHAKFTNHTLKTKIETKKEKEKCFAKNARKWKIKKKKCVLPKI